MKREDYRQTTLNLPVRVLAKIAAQATLEGRPQSQVIHDAVLNYLSGKENQRRQRQAKESAA
jgi:hypothetical protein